MLILYEHHTQYSCTILEVRQSCDTYREDILLDTVLLLIETLIHGVDKSINRWHASPSLYVARWEAIIISNLIRG